MLIHYNLKIEKNKPTYIFLEIKRGEKQNLKLQNSQLLVYQQQQVFRLKYLLKKLMYVYIYKQLVINTSKTFLKTFSNVYF